MSDQPIVVPRPAAPADDRGLEDRIRALRRDARAGAVVLACVALAAGFAWFRAGIAPGSPPSAPARVPQPSGASPRDTTTSAPAVTTSTLGAIVVHVVGAVRSPGVVSLPVGSRVIDAIRAAGGATPAADLARLNLAAKLGDGTRVAVPEFGRPPPALDPAAVSGSVDVTTDPAGGGSATAGGPSAPINVNSASEAQIEDLPGIGPTLAAAIVRERERNGPFRGIDDLTRVRGIGEGRLAQLRDFVAF